MGYINVLNYLNGFSLISFLLTLLSLISAVVIVFRLRNWSQAEWDDKKASDRERKLKEAKSKNESKTIVTDNKYKTKSLRSQYKKSIKILKFFNRLEKKTNKSTVPIFNKLFKKLKAFAARLKKFRTTIKNAAYILLALFTVFIFLLVPYLDNNADSVSGWFDKVCLMITNITGIESLSDKAPLAFTLYVILFFLAAVIIISLMYIFRLLISNNELIRNRLNDFFKIKLKFKNLLRIMEYLFVFAVTCFFILIPYLNGHNESVNSWFDKLSQMIAHITGIESLSTMAPLSFILYLILFITIILTIAAVLFIFKKLLFKKYEQCHLLIFFRKRRRVVKALSALIKWILIFAIPGIFVLIPYIDNGSGLISKWFENVCILISKITGVDGLSSIAPLSFLIYAVIFVISASIMILFILFAVAAIDKIRKGKEDYYKSLQDKITVENIIRIIKYVFVAIAIVIFFVIPHYSNVMRTIKDWLKEVYVFVDGISPNAFNASGKNYLQALIFYIFFFTVIAVIIISILSISRSIIFKKRKNDSKNETWINGYEAPIAILIVFAAILMSFSKGMPNFSFLPTNWSVLLMIILYILFILTAIEIVRLMLEQCSKENSLLKSVINLILILIIDFFSGIVLGVFYKISTSDIVSEIISLFFKDKENKIGKIVKAKIEGLFIKEVAKIEENYSNALSDEENGVINENITIWRRDNNHE